jgi:hypothetical protein
MQLRAERSPRIRTSVGDSAHLLQRRIVPWDALKRALTLSGPKEIVIGKGSSECSQRLLEHPGGQPRQS